MNRLKMIKQTMFGHAVLNLLRARLFTLFEYVLFILKPTNQRRRVVITKSARAHSGRGTPRNNYSAYVHRCYKFIILR